MAARKPIAALEDAARKFVRRQPGCVDLPTLPAPAPAPEGIQQSGRLAVKPPPMPVPVFEEQDDVIEVGAADLEDVEMDPSGVFVAPLGEADLAARGGSTRSVPCVVKTPSQLRALPLDPASAFLLGSMDGMTDVETLMDLVPLSREDVVRSLCLLVDHEVIELR